MKPAIVVLWEPTEAANADYFYDLEPLEVKQASLDVIPKFPNANSFKVQVVEPLPDWLNVPTEAFSPPARLGLEVSMANVVLDEGETWKDTFELAFALKGEKTGKNPLASIKIKIRAVHPALLLPPEPDPEFLIRQSNKRKSQQLIAVLAVAAVLGFITMAGIFFLIQISN